MLPADPYTQIELAFRIICFAHTQRVRPLSEAPHKKTGGESGID